jgi:hypothetical protein
MHLLSVFFSPGKAASLPSVFYLTLGKEELLCRVPEKKTLLCRVSKKKHSANHMALGKEPDSSSVSVWLLKFAV